MPADRRLSPGEHGDGAVADVRARGGHVGGAVRAHRGTADGGHAAGGAHQDQGEIPEPECNLKPLIWLYVDILY